ncbi:MAG: hypothetical protein J0G95_13380 [Rhizobiales bacterium]|nr:hypothetical protein [Hyphomicrobiales bacterium]
MEDVLKTPKVEGATGRAKPLNKRDPAQQKPDVPEANEKPEPAPKPLPE